MDSFPAIKVEYWRSGSTFDFRIRRADGSEISELEGDPHDFETPADLKRFFRGMGFALHRATFERLDAAPAE